MNSFFILLAAALVVAQFALPRRFAFVPLLVAICHFQNVPVVELGVAFSTCKLVIMAGLLRAFRDQTFVWFTRSPLDISIVVWAGWMLLSGFAHHPKDHNPITIRLSLIYDFVGSYLYARSLLRNRDDFLRFLKCLGVLMMPLAVEAIYEKTVHGNFYSLVSGSGQTVVTRDGRVRATGPFGHPILLGTFAAGSAILLIPLWHRWRRWMIVGTAACAVTVMCSSSSGPIMTLFSGLFGVALWRWRRSVGRIRTLIIAAFVALHLVMQAPVWYLMAKIDLTGGSTGWHRAELITAAINHLDEWWLVGTDYTRHWIAYGVPWSEYHIDITNQYIIMGVNGGLLLMLCFIIILSKAFQLLGRGIQALRKVNDQAEFFLWCVGAALFAHCFTFISISYFDQNFGAFGLFLGILPGLCAIQPINGDANRPNQHQEDRAQTVGMASELP